MQTFENWILIYLLKAVLVCLVSVLTIVHAYRNQVFFFAQFSFLVTDLYSVTMEHCKIRTQFQYEKASVKIVPYKARILSISCIQLSKYLISKNKL